MNRESTSDEGQLAGSVAIPHDEAGVKVAPELVPGGVGRKSAFMTTRWSVVARVGADDKGVGHMALSELCAVYWSPLYAYNVRQKP